MTPGRLRLEIGQSDLDRLGESNGWPLLYRNGALVSYQKLPLGFGATVSFYPALLSGWLTVTVPFRDIRGDRMGGWAGSLTRVLWSFLSDQVKQRLAPALTRAGLSPAALRIEQIRLDDNSQAALVSYPLEEINGWLQRSSQPLALVLSELECRPDAVVLEFVAGGLGGGA